MGAAQSIPSQVEGGQFSTTLPLRNKLTKPRTNSNTTRETWCLPSLPLSLSRPHLLGNSKSSSAVEYQTNAGDQFSGSIFAIEYLQTPPATTTNRRSGNWDLSGDHVSDRPAHADGLHANSMSLVDSMSPVMINPTLGSNGMVRRGSMITRSSTNNSSACAPPSNLSSEIPSMGAVRRRSQLLAAPPATATRKPTKSHRNSMDISDISLDPFSLAPVPDSDFGRCITPSGYSVLGAFKRGSLRIANGAASPAPSSCPGSPDNSIRNDFFESTFALPETRSSRPSSRSVKPIIVVPNAAIPAHEVRLVPPSPTDWRQEKDEKIPGSPFSFMQSPSTCDEDILYLPLIRAQPSDCEPDDLQSNTYGPLDSRESLISSTPSTVSAGVEYHKILTEQCLTRRFGESVCVETKNVQTTSPASSVETDGSHSTLFSENRKGNDRRLRRPSVAKISSEGTDSGYSSSGSVNSWKPTRSDQRMDMNSNTRKLGNSRLASKANSLPTVRGVEMIEGIEKKSRTKGVVAAIRRRYSQGDLKASARVMEPAKQPAIPKISALERKKTLTKPRPELRHRRSIISVTKSPIQQPEVQQSSCAITSVPPLPPSRLERKGSFNLLNLEGYLPLVRELPFTPIVDHVSDMTSISSIDAQPDTRESIIKIGVGKGLYRESRITGQDYYQRFSRRQHERAEARTG